MDQRFTTVGIEPVEDMLKRLNVSAAFGEPIKEEDVMIIPVASVGYFFGHGAGYGRSPVEPGGDETTADIGAGGGGGGGGSARPLGFIRISADEVKFEPIMDNSRISLFGIAMVMWNVFWISATVRAFAKK